MRVKVLYGFVVLVLFSCGSSQEEGAMDFEDFAGDTGTEDPDSTLAEDAVEENLTAMVKLISKMESTYDTIVTSLSHPLDRYGFSTSEKMRFKGKTKVKYGKSTMVTPTADFFYYSFADTNKTISAFYNYLDIIAEEGEGGPVKLNQDVESIKTPPMFMVVYDTIIVSAKYLCEHEKNDWNSFQDSILQVYGKDFKYQIDVDCGGPLKWK